MPGFLLEAQTDAQPEAQGLHGVDRNVPTSRLLPGLSEHLLDLSGIGLRAPHRFVGHADGQRVPYHTPEIIHSWADAPRAEF